MHLSDDEDFGGSGYGKTYRYLAAATRPTYTMRFSESGMPISDYYQDDTYSDIETSGDYEASGFLEKSVKKIPQTELTENPRTMSIVGLCTIAVVATVVSMLVIILMIRLYRRKRFQNMANFYKRGVQKDAFLPN